MPAIDIPASTDLIETARALAPRIRELADEIERERRLPPALVRELAAAGLFRLWMPRELGGDEVDPIVTMRVVEEVARADGSTGWCVMVAAQDAYFTPKLELEAARSFLTADDILAGSFSAVGRADVVEGGYRVSGRWPFASGAPHATWIFAICRVFDGGEPRTDEKGKPETVSFFLPAAHWQIIDTWHTTGMRGTGSQDVAVSDAFVPAERTFAGMGDTQRFGGPQYRPNAGLMQALRGSLALGIARHAMDVLVELSQTKKPVLFTDLLRDFPRVQAGIGQVEALVGSARSYLYDAAAEIWQVLRCGDQPTDEQRARLSLATAHAVHTAAQATEQVYRLAGSSAIYQKSPIERCFRDAQTAPADFIVAPWVYEAAGRVRLGLPWTTPLS
jgi:alkylation response protein AidB-like acyl-CoA dehydrogenase